MGNVFDFEKLNAKDAKVKFAFTKDLLQRSIVSPNELYPYFNEFIRLLDDPNNIIKWASIDIIGYLSTVDNENKIDRDILQRLFGLFHDDKLITCNHVIFALGLTAQNKPEYKDEIIQKLLKVQDNDFETDECEAIATGKVLDALNPFFDELKENKYFIDFVKFATKSIRHSTQQKAQNILKKLVK